MRFFIGTYSEDQGIWELRLDPESLAVRSCGCAASTRRNSYLAAAGQWLFAVSEVPLAEGSAGALHSFRITEDGLALTDTLEDLPPLLPHLWVNRAGSVVYTASYGTGEILAISVREGKFGEILSRTCNSGSSVDPKRQTCAHPHSVWLSPDEKWLYLCDLGTDEVLRWPLGRAGELLVDKRQSLSLPAGFGPRHMAITADGSRGYVLTEMRWHVVELSLAGEEMRIVRDVSLAGDIPVEGQGGGAIRLSEDETTLYCTNRSREHSRITVLDAAAMEPLQHLDGCRWPRDILPVEEAGLLLCGNQTEDSLSVFRRDSAGSWKHGCTVGGIPTPVCIAAIREST